MVTAERTLGLASRSGRCRPRLLRCEKRHRGQSPLPSTTYDLLSAVQAPDTSCHFNETPPPTPSPLRAARDRGGAGSGYFSTRVSQVRFLEVRAPRGLSSVGRASGNKSAPVEPPSVTNTSLARCRVRLLRLGARGPRFDSWLPYCWGVAQWQSASRTPPPNKPASVPGGVEKRLPHRPHKPENPGSSPGPASQYDNTRNRR